MSRTPAPGTPVSTRDRTAAAHSSGSRSSGRRQTSRNSAQSCALRLLSSLPASASPTVSIFSV
eukprot:3115611-Prymnesium_polylepis.1